MIYGLVLCGGGSSRMGKDKALMDYHGQPQFLHLYEMLEKYTGKVFLSANTTEKMMGLKPVIHDRGEAHGPFTGIVSAFEEKNNVAWLVVACDMPMIDESAIKELIIARDPNKIATCFVDPHSHLPQPLFTIWEPAACDILINHGTSYNYSLRKILSSENSHLVTSSRPEILKSANTPEEEMEIREMLKGV